MESLPITDIIISIVLLWGAWSGFRRGFILSIASLIALIAGAVAAFYFSDAIATWLAPKVDWSPQQVTVSSFAIAFLGVVIAVHFIAKALEKVLNLIALGLLNKSAGALFGASKNAILISFIIFGLNGFGNWLPENIGDGCVVYPVVESIAPQILPYWEDFSDKNNLEIVDDKLDALKEKIETGVEKVVDDVKEEVGE